MLVLDDLTSGHPDNLRGFRGELVQESVATTDLRRFGALGAIFHEAAVTDTTLVDEAHMTAVNVDGFRRVLTLAGAQRIPLVYASSAGVYGNGPTPMREDHPVRPLNAYARSKAEMDRLAREAMRDPARRIVGLRYFNVFGPRERFKRTAASMIWQLARQIREGRRPRIFTMGEQRRDHIYVSDVVEATLRAAEASRSGVVNVGTGVATTFNRLIELVNGALGTHAEPEYFDNPYTAAYQVHTEATVEQADQLLGFRARWTLEAGIHDYFASVSWPSGEPR